MEERPFSPRYRAEPVSAGASEGAQRGVVPIGGSELAGPELGAEERLALAFLVRRPPGTPAVYGRALRHRATWGAAREVRPLEARREHVELWLREEEAGGAAASTRAGRLAAVSGYYDVALDEGLLERPRRACPAAASRQRQPAARG